MMKNRVLTDIDHKRHIIMFCRLYRTRLSAVIEKLLSIVPELAGNHIQRQLYVLTTITCIRMNKKAARSPSGHIGGITEPGDMHIMHNVVVG